ncbi:MAG: sugar transferase [Flavobacteriales bacterium]|jgi:lipopolysaccharide/colanic/teichoic acid biosynthesis glycosyltransferase|nr:sugar transferase [Flavobacteriales bacterium]
MKKLYDFSKRVFDIICSIFGIIVFLPVLILVAIAVKVDSKGPIIFKQLRIGRNGKEYYIYKFRSMVVGAEKKGTGLFNFENDPRVTKVGNFIRNTSLDEIPQLFNILKGDMSFVGPRPPVNYELGDYKDFTGDLKARFRVKPGVTGYAQVNGRNEISWDEKIIFDNEYIEDFYKWGVLLDIKIILITIIKVIKNDGGYETAENAEKDRKRLKNDQ